MSETYRGKMHRFANDDYHLFRMDMIKKDKTKRRVEFYWDGLEMAIFGDAESWLTGQQIKQMRIYADSLLAIGGYKFNFEAA